MPSNINFLLDALLVDEAYVASSGNTEPSIVHGLFGNITVEPWTGFGKIIQDGCEVVEQLEGVQLQKAKRSLDMARDFIADKREGHARSSMIEKERKALYESKARLKSVKIREEVRDDVQRKEAEGSTEHGDVPGSIDASINAGTSTPVIAKSTKNLPESNAETTSNENAAKSPKTEKWHVRKPVTSSSSISDLHVHVMGALRALLKVMYPGEIFDLERRLISSENMIRDASESMLIKHVEEYLKGSRDQVPVEPGLDLEMVARGNIASSFLQEGNSSATEASGSEDVGNVTSQSRQLNNNPLSRRSLRLQEKCAKLRQKPSSDVQEEDNDNCIVAKPVMQLVQTPDQSLFRIACNDPGLIPVCCFEFKGPTVDLSGVMSSNTSAAAREPPNTCENLPQSSSQEDTTNHPSFGDMANSGGSSAHENEDDLYMPGRSARSVAEAYSSLFSDIRNMNRRDRDRTNESRNPKPILMPFAQVICQALLSKTGCVFVTNHQMAFALRIEEDQGNNSFGGKVFVTGAIPCDKEPGQFAALLGFTKYCIDRVLGKQENDLLDPLRPLLLSLSYSAYDANYVMEPLDPDWCPRDQPKATGGGRGSHSGTHHAGSHSTETVGSNLAEGRPSDSGFLPCKESAPGKPVKVDILSVISLNAQRCAQTANVSSSFTKSREGGLKTRFHVHRSFRSDMDERLKTLFASTKGLIAVGGSGIVVHGVWDGIDVSIKMWNRQSRDGFLNMRREIKVFRRLQTKCPSLLGSAVPRFLLGWDKPQENSAYRKQLVLLTELVGEGVCSDRDGNVWTDGEDGYRIVTNEDGRAMCKSRGAAPERFHTWGHCATQHARNEET